MVLLDELDLFLFCFWQAALQPHFPLHLHELAPTETVHQPPEICLVHV